MKKHDNKDYIVVRAPELDEYDFGVLIQARYKVVKVDDPSHTLDDAQGYGYKSKRAAYRAYAFKKSKKPFMSNKQRRELERFNSVEYQLAKEYVKRGEYATVEEAEINIEDWAVHLLKDGVTDEEIHQSLRKQLNDLRNKKGETKMKPNTCSPVSEERRLYDKTYKTLKIKEG